MATTVSCHGCRRSSKHSDGWWSVQELLRTYSLCPRCYRNKSLLALRETLMDRIKELETLDSDPAIKMGMELMKMRCIAIIRDTAFNN
jgi:hypothetical protein